MQPNRTAQTKWLSNVLRCTEYSLLSAIGQNNRSCPKLTPLVEPLLLCWPGKDSFFLTQIYLQKWLQGVWGKHVCFHFGSIHNDHIMEQRFLEAHTTWLWREQKNREWERAGSSTAKTDCHSHRTAVCVCVCVSAVPRWALQSLSRSHSLSVKTGKSSAHFAWGSRVVSFPTHSGPSANKSKEKEQIATKQTEDGESETEKYSCGL